MGCQECPKAHIGKREMRGSVCRKKTRVPATPNQKQAGRCTPQRGRTAKQRRGELVEGDCTPGKRQ